MVTRKREIPGMKLGEQIRALAARTMWSYVDRLIDRLDRRTRVVYCGDHRVLTMLPNGKSIYLDMRDVLVAPHIALGRNFEPGVSKVLRMLTKPGDRFFDVGANFGYHTFMMSDLVGGEPGSVHLFEPNPPVFDCLSKSVLKNGSWRNCVVNQLALSDEAGKVTLSVADNLWAGATIRQDPWVDVVWTNLSKETQTFEVDMVRLDDYCTEHGIEALDLIKIDVEGHEDAVVRGMGALLSSSPGLRIVMEFTYGAYSEPEKFWLDLHREFAHCHRIDWSGNLTPLASYDELVRLAPSGVADLVWTREPIDGMVLRAVLG